MSPIYEEMLFLSAGEANAEQEISLPVLVAKFIDIATAHANSLDIGNPSMRKIHAGWVLSRLTIEMNSYPAVNQCYVISTWIESFNRHFSERSFCVKSQNGEIYGYARSIWMVMDTYNHSNIGLSHFTIPSEMILGKKAPIEKQARHTDIIESCDIPNCKALKATDSVFKYSFNYCDLDSYRHVDTVRYVELLLNRFSLSEFDSMFVNRLELSFLHEAKYGIETKLLRSDNYSDNVFLTSFQLKATEDDSSLLFARMFRKERIKNESEIN